MPWADDVPTVPASAPVATKMATRPEVRVRLNMMISWILDRGDPFASDHQSARCGKWFERFRRFFGGAGRRVNSE